MKPARVVLVDDDPSIRRLVTLALEDLPIDLVACASGAEALAALRAAPARLLITDLMMPGMSGLELLQRLAEEPALRGGARLLVYSAGLTAEAQAQLAGLDVWRELAKPVSVLTLVAAVEEGLSGTAAPAASDAAAREPPVGEADAIRTHFAGNAALFHAFKAGCAAQFRDDLHELQAALLARDGGSLRRLGHNLKSVLHSLGFALAAGDARRLETAAAASDWAACTDHAAGLHAALEPLASPAGQAGSR